MRRLVFSPGPSATSCADCAGLPTSHVCADCGIEDKLYQRGRCAPCSLRRRAEALLAAGAAHVPAELVGVFDAIVATRRPRSALNWLRKGAGAAVLADLAAGRITLTHEALDAHPHPRTADYLRHVLVANAALPPRDDDLARTAVGLSDLLNRVERPQHRRLVKAYTTWRVMRRLRRVGRTVYGCDAKPAPAVWYRPSDLQWSVLGCPSTHRSRCPMRTWPRSGRQPSWPGRVAAAHTVPREISGETRARLDAVQAAKIKVPVLPLTGEEGTDPAKAEVDGVAAALPDARLPVLAGQHHVADILDPESFAKHMPGTSMAAPESRT